MIVKKIFLFGTFMSLVACELGNQSVSAIVEIENGFIQGVQEGNLKKYLGIPYAEPPIDELRWAPTKPAQNWKGVKSVESNSKICFQPKQLADFYDRVPDINNMSEDCLTLNIWTRAKNKDEKLPVMVWFHGGALVWGSGSEYPGDELTQHGVILVTVNYRLGPLGFFSHPELSIETGSSGNQGFNDQIRSLEWVKENISQFGGDPNNVTIFGESAGSWSVNVLQASPLSKGLFHKAIGQSGARLIPLTHLNKRTSYSKSAEKIGLELSSVMSGNNNSSLEDLKKIPALTIIENIEKDPLYATQFDKLTVIDGHIIPEDISQIFLKGDQADVPVLIGSTADEATPFDPKMLSPQLAAMSYKSLTHLAIADMLPKVDGTIYDLYPVDTEQVAKKSWVDFSTDAMFTAQMQKWGNLMSSVESPAYLYMWNWYPSIDGSREFRAFHAAEVPYIFGNFDVFDIDLSERDQKFSKVMMKIWTSFAKNGVPSLDTKEWPKFESKDQKYVLLDERIEIKKGLRTEKVRLINEAYDKVRNDFQD
ncbi:carboxylesterase family protein [Gammaproteobacteria bacterium]|nr:carboxylesterase family protein [Gammaproteobacteria bacterium]